jgi:hypothetical protein
MYPWQNSITAVAATHVWPPPYLDVSLAEQHLHGLLHDGQQPSVVHRNTTPHQVTQPQDLQAAAASTAVRCQDRYLRTRIRLHLVPTIKITLEGSKQIGLAFCL